MKSDPEIKKDVEAELRWSADINETDIATKVNGGVVTLTGFVGTYVEKCRAEATAKRVAGVTAVANDIEVRLPKGHGATDPEIARQAVEVLKRELPLEWDSIKPLVRQGQITLEGSVTWQYQRERAVNAVTKLKGVTAVNNAIRVTPTVAPDEIKHKIEEAFRRSAEVDASNVSIETHGSEITLRGEVRSWAERDQAQMTAWSAPGVTNVKNEISVRT
jgi:osmotically-inducible protein OsmY